MKFGRVVRPDMPASLRVIGDEFSSEFVGMRGILPTFVIRSGTIEEMVRYVLAQPRERHWRYFLKSGALPYLTAEEMQTLAADAGWNIRQS